MNVLVKGYRIQKRTRKNTLLGPVDICSIGDKIYRTKEEAGRECLIQNLSSNGSVSYSVIPSNL